MTVRQGAVAAALVVLAALVGAVAFSGVGWSGGEGSADRDDAFNPSETLRLEVDLSERTLSVIQEGEVVGTHPVTVGSAAHPTPTGSYHIDWVVWNPSWHPPDNEWARGKEPVAPGWNNPMGRVKMFFRKPAYYVHGTRELQDLGRAASHGCVRMSNADVLDVARVVMEHGGEPRPPNWFKRVINRLRDTREVTLPRPVPVEIRE